MAAPWTEQLLHEGMYPCQQLTTFSQVFICVCMCCLLLYSAVLCSRAFTCDSALKHSHVILHEWIDFYSTFLNPLKWCTYSAGMKLLPSRHILCTPYKHVPCHFMQSHIHKVHACLAVTCHLHFWQNDRDLLHATAVTRGWNGYRNMSQHRKLTLEKKILPPFLQGFEPMTFQSRVQHSNHWAIPTPCVWGRGGGVQVVLFPTTNPCIPSVSSLTPSSPHTHTHLKEDRWKLCGCVVIIGNFRSLLLPHVICAVPVKDTFCCWFYISTLGFVFFFRFIGTYYNDREQYYLQHHKAIKTTAIYLTTTQTC